MKREKTKLKKTGLITTVLLLIVTAIQLFPLYWMFTFSLKSNKEIFGGNIIGLPENWEWDNYVKIFDKAHLGRYLFNSVVVTGFTIVFTLILSAMATYAIVRLKWKLSNAVYFIFLTGMMLSIHAVLLPLFVNMKPLLDTYWALIIPYVAFAMPTAILLMVGSLEALPKELEEAAFIDGANIYRVFWQIIMPLMKPILSTVAILTFLSSWNEMMLAIAFVSGEKYKTITVGVNDMVGKYSTKWGLIGAGLTIATIPTLVLYVFLSKNIQKSLAMGAVKG
ncbi:carbohydrate ABC transporter permease [Parablautia muri]|uniref:Carbohydrate ABC transporter permease n=1 Tax=Parablautia muri TaxID=2320879 RepID=A0A9X5GQ77_9FIRM|nr:carbohydrate ABC transporter permease [Parablautia muri]NBJ91778.1 carbohydrate ABC transporter permease [Parablautia muri]